jgi:hypothetical protein
MTNTTTSTIKFCHDLVETDAYEAVRMTEGIYYVTPDTLDRMADDFDWPLNLDTMTYDIGGDELFRIVVEADGSVAVPPLTWQPCGTGTCDHTGA